MNTFGRVLKEALSQGDDFEPGMAGRRLCERARTDSMYLRKLRILVRKESRAGLGKSGFEAVQVCLRLESVSYYKASVFGPAERGCFPEAGRPYFTKLLNFCNSRVAELQSARCLMKLLHILIFHVRKR